MKKINNLKVKIPILSFLLSIILMCLYIFIDHSIFESQISQIFMKNSVNKIHEREIYFQNQLKNTQNTLLAIRNNKLFLNYLKEKKSSKVAVESLFQQIIRSNKWMMQVRFINNKGIEEIRFDRKSFLSNNIINITDFQDKSSKYYFIKNIKKKEEVWFSKVDLNIEYNKIETPFKPTYRAVLPVVQDGFKGILVINYFVEPLLKRLFHAPLYDSILVDKDGYILYHYNKDKNWSRYQEKPFKIERRYLKNIKKSFYYNDKFVVKKLELPFENELFLILQLNKKNLIEQHELYKTKTIIVVLIYMFLMLIVSAILFAFFKKFETNKLYIQILTKAKRDKNKLLIQKTKMASMGEMLANIAHQWRQPLAAIAINTTHLERKNKKGKLTKEFVDTYVDTINYTIQNMSQTIEDFSDFFKPNKEKVSFDLTKIIDEALIILTKNLLENSINIEFDNSVNYNYKSYKNELLQVLLNIIKNAKDAIKIANINNGTIKIKIIENKNNYEISIADNGTGISEDILDKIFEPYFTTKFQDKGTGIGLYMCKIIIEDSLQGEIELKNKNNGTLCTIKLPKE